jgi:hypothetical protein
MVKHHLRKDRMCLNCGASIPDRYCSHCGQENLEPKETTSHLVRHFFEDITHYDSKFFATIRRLLFSPGYLTKEYLAGRRVRHLNPVRMYVFISAVFFLTLYFNKPDEKKKVDAGDDLVTRIDLRKELADSLNHIVRTKSGEGLHDSIEKQVLSRLASSLYSADSARSEEQSVSLNVSSNGISFLLKENRYSSVDEYDSVQNSLSNDKRDKGWLHWLIRTNVRLKERYGSRSEVIVKESFDRNVPKLMFILLPLFALFIKWFHNSKKYYYAQHVIFSIHYHSFIFMFFLVFMLLLLVLPNGIIKDILRYGSLLLLVLYLVLALRRAYNQSFGVALIKGISISILYIMMLIVSLFLLAAFIFFTA